MSAPISYLNKLPKDMLINLIQIIQDKQKCENKYLKDFIFENGFGKRCCHLQCDHLFVSRKTSVSRFNRDLHSCMGTGSVCEKCHKYWCVYHRDESDLKMLVHKSDKKWNCGPVCDGCIDSYVDPNNFYGFEEYDVVPIRKYSEL